MHLDFRMAESALLFLSSATLAIRGLLDLMRFMADRNKLPASYSRLSRVYPNDYKHGWRWVANGLIGLICLGLGGGLFFLLLSKLR